MQREQRDDRQNGLFKRWEGKLRIIGIAGAVYLAMKYIVPLVIPFLIALAICVVLQPMIRKIHQKTRINRGLLAAICLLAVGGLILLIMWLLGSNLLRQLKILISRMDYYEYQLKCFLHNCCGSMEAAFGVDARRLESITLQNVEVIIDRMQVNFFPKVMNYSFSYLRTFVEFFSVIIVTIISTVLLVKDYEKIMASCRKYPSFRKIRKMGKNLYRMGLCYIRAQLTIMLVISVICTVGLLLMGNPYALLIGLLIGVLDALPFIGTGIILVPWAILTVLQGDILKAAFYLILYTVCALTREFMEPKLIGKKVGVYPIAIILTIYVGIKLYGGAGIVLGPATALVILEIYKMMGEDGEPEAEEKT